MIGVSRETIILNVCGYGKKEKPRIAPSGAVNFNVPRIAVRDMLNGVLYLEHLDRRETFLDRSYAKKTLEYIAEIWGNGKVYLLTCDEQGNEVSLFAE